MQSLQEYDAKDVDVRISAGIAVLLLSTDNGRVAISLTPETLERLALRMQLELSKSLSSANRPAFVTQDLQSAAQPRPGPRHR